MATTEQTRYGVATIDEIPHGGESHGRLRYTVRKHFGIEGFGVNAVRAVTLDEDGRLINEHTEDGAGARGQEELYVVLSGRATFTLDGDEIDAAPGTLVFVRPEATRGAVAREEGTTVLIVGGTPGEAFRISPGELVDAMWEPYNSGDFDQASETLRVVLADHPSEGIVLFNLACCESRAGRTEDALDYLAKAVGAESRFAQLAQEDEDLDPIRDEPRFKQLVG
jgi:quercetin dioxygenase-like cupin family protein